MQIAIDPCKNSHFILRSANFKLLDFNALRTQATLASFKLNSEPEDESKIEAVGKDATGNLDTKPARPTKTALAFLFYFNPNQQIL